MKQNLRVGILLESLILPQWLYAMIEQIQQADYAEIVLLGIDKQGNRPKSTKRGATAFLTLYQKIDQFLFARNCHPDAFAPKDSADLVKNIPVVDLAETTIQSYKLDVLLNCLYDHQEPIDWQYVATYGLWSLSISSQQPDESLPAGFRDVFIGAPTTEATLLMQQTAVDKLRILYRSWSSTHPLSPYANRNHLFWKAALFVPRALAQLHRLGETAFFASAEREHAHALAEAYADKQTEQSQIPGMIINQFYKIGKKALLRLFYRDQWFLLYRFQSAEVAGNFQDFKQILPPKGQQFWADPHVIYADGSHYIFLEELPTGADKAHISVMKMDQTGQYSLPTRVLERPYHLSYPFVFFWEEQYYMIPETMDNGTIELYRCTAFPHEWEFAMNLMEGIRAVDTTLLFHHGKWWLFAAMTEAGNIKPWDELFLFYADTLFTQQWTPHPLNPIVSDVRTARPAGKIFRYKNNLYRPAQNCSVRYGYGLKINQITELSETNYQEVNVVSAEPVWDAAIDGIHSYSHDHGLTVIDGFWWRRKF